MIFNVKLELKLRFLEKTRINDQYFEINLSRQMITPTIKFVYNVIIVAPTILSVTSVKMV